MSGQVHTFFRLDRSVFLVLMASLASCVPESKLEDPTGAAGQSGSSGNSSGTAGTSSNQGGAGSSGSNVGGASGSNAGAAGSSGQSGSAGQMPVEPITDPCAQRTCGGVCEQGACHGLPVCSFGAGPDPLSNTFGHPGVLIASGEHLYTFFDSYVVRFMMRCSISGPWTRGYGEISGHGVGLALDEQGTLWSVGESVVGYGENEGPGIYFQDNVLAPPEEPSERTYLFAVTEAGGIVATSSGVYVTARITADGEYGVFRIDESTQSLQLVPGTESSTALGTIAATPGGKLVYASHIRGDILAVDPSSEQAPIVLFDGPEQSPTVPLTPYNHPDRGLLALDNDVVFTVINGELWSAQTDGQMAPKQHLTGLGDVSALAVNQGRVFWITRDTKELKTWVENGVIDLVAQGISGGEALLFSDGYLAWAEEDTGWLRKIKYPVEPMSGAEIPAGSQPGIQDCGQITPFMEIRCQEAGQTSELQRDGEVYDVPKGEPGASNTLTMPCNIGPVEGDTGMILESKFKALCEPSNSPTGPWVDQLSLTARVERKCGNVGSGAGMMPTWRAHIALPNAESYRIDLDANLVTNSGVDTAEDSFHCKVRLGDTVQDSVLPGESHLQTIFVDGPQYVDLMLDCTDYDQSAGFIGLNCYGYVYSPDLPSVVWVERTLEMTITTTSQGSQGAP